LTRVAPASINPSFAKKFAEMSGYRKAEISSASWRLQDRTADDPEGLFV
jgi:hypothetical protein